VLARLVDGDPLGLRTRLAAELAREALLVDVERALLRLQSLVALRARDWIGSGGQEPFLAACVSETLRELAQEEEAGTFGEPLEFCCRPLGLDARAFAEACRGFNRLPSDVRQAFVAAVLEGEAPERAARARRLSLGEFARRARTGLELFRAHAALRERA
jgi:DNA-directed RNA polymerase specialized sigma24 family protein